MKSGLMLTVCLTAALLALPSGEGRAEDSQDEIIRKVGLRQNRGSLLPLDLTFRDEDGRPVTLGRYFGERPVILTPVYYECPMMCTLILNGFLDGVREIPYTAGRDYEIVTFSIDPGETAALARQKKSHYLAGYGREGSEAGWHFLTAEGASIERLTEVLGYGYAYDPVSGEYAHPSAIMVATAEGKISHYFTGIEFPPQDLRLALVEASNRRMGSVMDQALLLCFHYNPETGKYGFVISSALRAAGLVTVIALGLLIFKLRGRERTQTP